MEPAQEASRADLRAERDTDGAEQVPGESRPNWIVPTGHLGRSMDDHGYKQAAYRKAAEALREHGNAILGALERDTEHVIAIDAALDDVSAFKRCAEWLEAQT